MTFRIYFIGWYLYVIILSFDYTVDIKKFLSPNAKKLRQLAICKMLFFQEPADEIGQREN